MIRRVAVCGLVVFFVVALAQPLLAQKPPQFSADMNFSGSRGMASNGKLYFGGERARMEMNAQGRESIVISDMTRKVSYILMPQQHMYMEMSTEMQGRRGPDWRLYDASNPCANMPDVTCQKVGTDIVDGRSCNKWQFTGKGQGSNRTIWIDQKTGIPIKSQSADGSTMELTNIKEGPQSASLFEIPAGYQKMDMGNMMQQMQNMQRPH